jgi:hypothetical protein
MVPSRAVQRKGCSSASVPVRHRLASEGGVHLRARIPWLAGEAGQARWAQVAAGAPPPFGALPCRPIAPFWADPSHPAACRGWPGSGGLRPEWRGGALAEGARRIARGDRPGLQEALLSPGNVRRITERLAEMRGAAMKMGQLLSMDAGDLLPPELAQVMGRLRSDAAPMPARQLGAVLDGEWGAGWRGRFEDSTRARWPRPPSGRCTGRGCGTGGSSPSRSSIRAWRGASTATWTMWAGSCACRGSCPKG